MTNLRNPINRNQLLNYRSKKNPSRKGLILIADISGFTKFVRETNVYEGSRITQILLTSLLESNTLNMEVSEIEGDAILFYKYEKPSIDSIIRQYETMLQKFNTRINLISNLLKRKLDLSLKVIAHYGSITEYHIGNFKKLYGESVIEAHRLLKNTVPSRSYVLITDYLLRASCGQNAAQKFMNTFSRALKSGEDSSESPAFAYCNYEEIPALVHKTPKF